MNLFVSMLLAVSAGLNVGVGHWGVATTCALMSLAFALRRG